MDLTGLDTLERQIAGALTRLLQGVGSALRQEAGAILDVSRQLVPIDTHDLVRSGEIEGPTQDGATTTVQIRYGGHGAVPYAAEQHFDTSFQHPRGGQAFYLQQPVFEATAGMLERLAVSLQHTLGV